MILAVILVLAGVLVEYSGVLNRGNMQGIIVNQQTEVSKKTEEMREVVKEEQASKSDVGKIEKKLVVADYEKWMIEPSKIELEWYKNRGDWALSMLERFKKPADCFSVYNQDSSGGDLLSSLIADKALRDALEANFVVYTQDYLIGLENKIVGKLQKDFYATSVCNAGKGVDVLTGVLLPRGTTVKKEGGAFYGNGSGEYKYKGLENVLIVANNSDVTAYTDIELFDNTAAGGETNACKPSLAGNILTWTCFISTGDGGANYKDWQISLDSGKVSEGKEYFVKS